MVADRGSSCAPLLPTDRLILAKPFEPRELVARIRSILKRCSQSTAEAPILDYGDLQIDRRRQEIRVLSQTVALTTREFQLLELLASSPGEKFSRDAIIARLGSV